jgi:hypothetical protein
LHLNIERLQFLLKRLGDALQSVLAREIGRLPPKRGDQSSNRTGENHFTGPFLIDPLADELLRQFQGCKDVSLKSVAYEINRNFTDWTVFADPGVAVSPLTNASAIAEIAFSSSPLFKTLPVTILFCNSSCRALARCVRSFSRCNPPKSAATI